MIRILKNISTVPVETTSYGVKISIDPKKSLTIDHPNADKAADEVLQRYDFLKDITPITKPHVETKQVPEQNKKGRTVYKTKKVVKKAKGVSL